MKVKTTLSERELGTIAESLNVKLYNYRQRGKYQLFTLKPLGKQFRTRGFWNPNRHNWSVCLHGYTMFMLKVFEKDMKAIFKSGLATVTADNIEEVFEDLRYNNVGSEMNPRFYEDNCFCNDDVIESLWDLMNEIYYKIKEA